MLGMDQTTPAPAREEKTPLPPQARQALGHGRLKAVVYGALRAVINGGGL